MNARTVSEWINYLTAVTEGVNASVLGLGAMLLSVLVIVFGRNINIVVTIVSGLGFASLFAYVYVKSFRPAKRLGDGAQKLLNEIMMNGLDDVDKIAERWKHVSGYVKTVDKNGVSVAATPNK